MTDDELIKEMQARLLTTRGAAKVIGFSHPNAVTTLINRGQLKAYRFSGEYWFIFKTEAERYRDERPGKGGRPKKTKE